MEKTRYVVSSEETNKEVGWDRGVVMAMIG